MRSILLSALLGLALTGAAAAEDSCKARAGEKKLAGAALNSFMKKCQNDAQAACDTQATERRLNGAARNSFTKKCANDAVGI